MEAYDIIIQLKAMFGKAARVERFKTVTAILESRQKDDEPVGYANFVVNYHMNNMDKTVHELLGMLKTAEKSIKGEPKKNVLMVQKKKNAFKKGGNKNKKKASGNQGAGKTVAKSAKQLLSLPKLKMDLVLTRSASIVIREGIGKGIAQST
ncbi:hypothetical protein Salat_1713800 [Sesamum alatum]|uniref:Uncharacterized protein n=1 Tax=Sesamum alatum TaxID=300844 RepID=A0AAE1Y7N3_9LAMI|nr:hypothetical protein Salat_1713800 [Sesamum alatum]